MYWYALLMHMSMDFVISLENRGKAGAGGVPPDWSPVRKNFWGIPQGLRHAAHTLQKQKAAYHPLMKSNGENGFKKLTI